MAITKSRHEPSSKELSFLSAQRRHDNERYHEDQENTITSHSRTHSLSGNPLVLTSLNAVAPHPRCLSSTQVKKYVEENEANCLGNTSLDGVYPSKILPCKRPIREHSLSGNPLPGASIDESLSSTIFETLTVRKQKKNAIED
jgi:hypothetical protein